MTKNERLLTSYSYDNWKCTPPDENIYNDYYTTDKYCPCGELSETCNCFDCDAE